MIKKILKPAVDFLRGFLSKHEKTVNCWKKDDGDKLRYKYNLNSNSIVFDLGGYIGQWTNDIYSRYNCNIFVFEPVESFYKNINKRFEGNNKIKVFNFGLSDENKEADISIKEDASSLYAKGGKNAKIKLVKASDFIKEKNIKKIDLMKINIEGGEYDLMEEIISSGTINQIENIQIQFHHFIDNAEKRMKEIQTKLEKTHHTTFQYKFVWENWEKNKI